MHHRTATAAVLGITALTLLVLPGCSPSSPAPTTTSSSDSTAQRPGTKGDAKRNAVPMASAQLRERLLDESDLGTEYARKPDRPAGKDDVTVLGCPALDELGADAATGSGGGLDFPHQAKAAFTYTGNGEVTEELYSDTGSKLSDGTGRIFDAMTGCPAYQVLAGSTPVDIATQEIPAPRLGDERWSHLLTFSSGGAETVVKQTAIRDGSVLLIVSGSPALVDRHLGTALAKATATG